MTRRALSDVLTVPQIQGLMRAVDRFVGSPMDDQALMAISEAVDHYMQSIGLPGHTLEVVFDTATGVLSFRSREGE